MHCKSFYLLQILLIFVAPCVHGQVEKLPELKSSERKKVWKHPTFNETYKSLIRKNHVNQTSLILNVKFQ